MGAYRPRPASADRAVRCCSTRAARTCARSDSNAAAKCRGRCSCCVICLDNFFTGQKQNIAHLLGKPNFELVRHDVIEPILLEVDQIYNLACPASPVHYQYNPVKTIKTSVMGAINMLGLAKRVQGDGSCRPRPARSTATRRCIRRPESYWGNVNPIGHPVLLRRGQARAPRRCSSTTTGRTAWTSAIVRIFNTYGPRMHPNDGRVVSQLHRPGAAAARTSPSTAMASQTRSFCYVDDLIEGMMRMMNSRRSSSAR